MGQAIADAVVGPRIASRCADRYAQGCGCLKRLIERLQRLRCPVIFGGSPTDRDDGRFVFRVVHGRCNGVQKPFVGIWCKIHN
jgi:hypothetical protein